MKKGPVAGVGDAQSASGGSIMYKYTLDYYIQDDSKHFF